MQAACDKRDNQRWVNDLASAGAAGREANEALRAVLIRGLRRVLAPRGVDPDTIEDFVQESMIKVLERLPSFRGESRFTTWAMAVAVRVAFSELRRARWRDVSLDAMLERPLGDSLTMRPDADRSIQRHQVHAVMERVIRTELTERQRRALRAELAGIPKIVVADALETTVNALYKLSHDARKRLRQGILDAGISDAEVRETFDLSPSGDRMPS